MESGSLSLFIDSNQINQNGFFAVERNNQQLGDVRLGSGVYHSLALLNLPGSCSKSLIDLKRFLLQGITLRFPLPHRQTLKELSTCRGMHEDALWAYCSRNPLIKYIYLKRLSAAISLIPKGTSVLEIGCGSGMLLSAMKVETAIGVDFHNELSLISGKMRKAGHELNLLRCDLRHPPFREKAFNCIIGVSVVEHLDQSDLARAFQELRRLLIPSGILVLGYPIENLIVRLFFWVMRFDFTREHPSKASDIREATLSCFHNVERLRLPHAKLPDLLAYYELTVAS